MSALLEELARENVRTLKEALARRRPRDSEIRDAEDDLRMALRYYEDIKVARERLCELLKSGINTGRVDTDLRTAIALFDDWLGGAADAGAFAETVANRSGCKLAILDEFREAVEKMKLVRKSATDSLECTNAPLAEVPPQAISAARALYEQGSYRDLGEALASRLGKP